MLSQLAIPVCSFSPKSAYMKTPVAPRHCTTGEGNPLLCGRLLLGRASSRGVTEKRDVCACHRLRRGLSPVPEEERGSSFLPEHHPQLLLVSATRTRLGRSELPLAHVGTVVVTVGTSKQLWSH